MIEYLPSPAKPVIKYAGGKTQLLPEILRRTPSYFRDYHEPFVGGGAMFFALYRLGRLKGKQAYLGDTNPHVINLYRQLQTDAEAVVRLLQPMVYERTFYEAQRKRRVADMSPVEHAAWFVYLNKTGYNGMWRVNKSGMFNVPFGRYTNPTICDAQGLRDAGEALKCAVIKEQSYIESLDSTRTGDFVFLDPPYLPTSKTANFVGYTSAGFDKKEHELLAGMLIALKERGVLFVACNSEIARDLYPPTHFTVSEILAARAVSCDPEKREKVVELMITSSNQGEKR